MKKQTNRRTMRKLMAASAVGLAGLSASRSNADVIVNGVLIDVRATQLNGVPLADPKHVIVQAGDVVTFNLFAQVTGTNGLDDDGFQSINGAIRSSTGGLLGNLTAQTIAPFNGNGSSAGTTIDVDSDGDLDVTGANPNLAGGYFNPRNAAGFSTDGTRIGTDTEQFLIGGAAFTVGANAIEGQQTIVNYLHHRTAAGGNNLPYGIFLIDGNSNGNFPRNADNTMIAGSGVLVETVPEPTGLALPALATLGLLPRRKKRA